ncbi:prion-inhibition and propagation-domain-containing protein [Xylariomycetidae sp. FL2044]|nr:prion-inhibition and propagation-domain-containing protein [Xylariomycetidae sp. FL2044]
MAEVAGLALGVLGVASLFTSCIENFDIIVRAREFSEQFELQCTLLSLQRLRLAVWGETLGLAPPPGGPQRPYNEALDRHDIRPAIVLGLNQLRLLLNKADVINGKYALQENEACVVQTEVAVTSLGMTIFREPFEKFRDRIKKNQKQKSVWKVTKWSIHDQAKFESTVNNITKLIDGLESIMTPLGLVQQQRARVEEEIESLSDAESLRLLQELGSSPLAPPSLRAISETASLRLESVESSSRSYYTARTRSSHTSALRSTFARGAGAKPEQALAYVPVIEQPEPEDATTYDVSPAGKDQPPVPTEEPTDSHEPREEQLADLPQHQRWMAALTSRLRQHERQPSLIVDASDYGTALRPSKRQDDEVCSLKLGGMAVMADSGLSLARRTFIELRNIRRAGVPFISAVPVGDALDQILASIEGPPGTPYEGGVFYIMVRIAEGNPPALRFHTRIYHPNIHPSGRVCADYAEWWHNSNLLNGVAESHNRLPWFSEHITNHYTLGALLVAICGLLASPNIDDPLVPEIAEKYLTDYEGYCAAAKLYTERYAHACRPSDDELAVRQVSDSSLQARGRRRGRESPLLQGGGFRRF